MPGKALSVKLEDPVEICSAEPEMLMPHTETKNALVSSGGLGDGIDLADAEGDILVENKNLK